MEINELIDSLSTDDTSIPIEDIVQFLESHDWFGVTAEFKNGSVLVDDSDAEDLKRHIIEFANRDHGFDALVNASKAKFPETTEKLIGFMDSNDIDKDVIFSTLDFLCEHLTKELFKYNDKEAKELVTLAAKEIEKGPGDCLTFFMSVLHKDRLTSYSTDFTMEKRFTMNENGAYSFDEYLQIFFYLFNEQYIEENNMWEKAAKSRNYTDTWLYLAISCLCSLRQPDLERIYHPILPCTAQEVINKVMQHTFTDNEARETLLSITRQLNVLPFAPHKTKSSSGIDWIKFEIPTSCEVMIGKLFALAEAHRQLEGIPETPIIRKISTYKEIRKYMGDEIGTVFLESDFRARSATKSYLQLIFTHADEILSNEPGESITVRGYVLASLARSHKGSYGEYATSTFEYLKDAKLSGRSPEFIAFQLLERGVLSFTASMLLSMITNREYDNLDPAQQTEAIKMLALRPSEIENIVSIVDANMERSKAAVIEAERSGKDLIEALQNIASGMAFSKQPQVYCLKTALQEACPYPEIDNCVSCPFEISTKSTFCLMAQEYNRLYLIHNSLNEGLEKEKCKAILMNIVVPKLNETLSCIKKQYGEKTFLDFEALLKENLCNC